MTLTPGADLGPSQFPITRADLVRYAGASGDFNPIHWSERVATDVGLPGVLALADLRGDDLPDFAVLQAVTIELAALVAVGMAAADVLHAWADPRVRAGGGDG